MPLATVHMLAEYVEDKYQGHYAHRFEQDVLTICWNYVDGNVHINSTLTSKLNHSI